MRYLAVAVLLLTCGVAWAGNTVVVTTASDGTPANADVTALKLSGDGKVAAFITVADNLVAGDTNGTKDLFTKNLATGDTRRVSLTVDGSELRSDITSCAVNRDGTFVTFATRADVMPSGPPLSHPLVKPAIYLAELPSGPITAIFRDPSTEGGPVGNIIVNSVSANGRYVAFNSDLPMEPWEGTENAVYVWDGVAEGFLLVTVNTLGEMASGTMFFGPAMTPDGRYVIFASSDSDLITDDTNEVADVFLRDLVEGTTQRVSLTSNGGEIGGSSSAYPAISPDGRYVSFICSASVTGLPAGNAQAFVRDVIGGTTQAVSTNGTEMSNTSCWGSYISSGETHIALFQSAATNLVPGLTDGESLIYQRDLTHGITDIVSCTDGGQELVATEDGKFAPSEDGATVAFMAQPSSSLSSPGAVRLGPTQGYRRERGPFWDVGSRHWAVTQIEDCYEAAIVGGYSDHSYRPTATVTRDQMAVFIARALAGGDAAIPTGPPVATFPDVDTDHWAYRYVEYAAANGVVGGYEDGSYQPGLVVTRDAMAVFVARGMAGGEEAVPTGPPTATFSDVATNHWAYPHVEHCAAAGVVAGYPDGTYRPDDAVDRAQMAVYVERAFLGG